MTSVSLYKKVLIFDLCAILLCTSALVILCTGSRKTPVEKNLISDADSSKAAVQVTVTKNQTKRWFDDRNILMGAQFDGTIQNTTMAEVTDWKVVISIPQGSYIDSSWNGQYSVSDSMITILPPPDYNRSVPPKGSITFGFIMYAPQEYEAKSILVTYRRRINLHEMPLFWILVFLTFGITVSAATFAVSMFRLQTLNRKEQQAQEFITQILKLFAKTIEAKDLYTQGHSERVSCYAEELAKRAGLSEKQQKDIFYIAILHDVGKIGVPDTILNKCAKLTDSEMTIMRRHAAVGGEILASFTLLPDTANIVRHHHERYDGRGYPDGLKGEDIPLISRIICIADSFDAMTSDRCYRKKISIDQAATELIRCSGTQFDPNLVNVMLDMIKDGTILAVTSV